MVPQGHVRNLMGEQELLHGVANGAGNLDVRRSQLHRYRMWMRTQAHPIEQRTESRL